MANDAVVGVLRALLQLNTAEYDSPLKKSAAETKNFAKVAETAVAPALAKVEAQMTRTGLASARMLSYLQGDKLLANANAWVRQVEKVGGATKLTESEAARLNATLTKAIDKYRVLGQEAPKDMLALERQTRKTAAATQDLVAGMSLAGKKSAENFAASQRMVAGMSAAARAPAPSNAVLGTSMLAGGLRTAGRSLLAPLGVAALATGSVMLVRRMASDAFEAASSMVDLSNKTGLTTDTLQRMQYVAGQTGSSLDNFSDASFKLGVRLSGGSGSVREAVKELGIDFDRLQSQSPSEQFETVAIALSHVTDATDRNRLGLELFGKSYAGIAGSVAEGYDTIAKKAPMMSEATIKALERAGDAWDRLTAKVKIYTGTAIAALLPPEGRVEANERYLGMTKGQRAMVDSLQGEGRGILLKDALDMYDAIFETARKKRAENKANSRDFIAELAEVDAKVAKLTATEREQLDAAIQLGGDALETVMDRLGLTAVAVDRYSASLKANTKDTKAAADQAKKYADELQAIRSDLTGQDDINAAQKMLEAIGTTDVTGLAPEQQARIYETLSKAIAAYEQAGRIAPAAMKVLAESTRRAANSVDGSADSIVSSVGAINDKLTELADRQGDADAMASLGSVKTIDDFLRAQADRQDELDRIADEDERRMAEDERRDAEHIQKRREAIDDELAQQAADDKARADAFSQRWVDAAATVMQVVAHAMQAVASGMGAQNAAVSTGMAAMSMAGPYGSAVASVFGGGVAVIDAKNEKVAGQVRAKIAYGDFLRTIAMTTAAGVQGSSLQIRANKAVTASYLEIGLTAEDATSDLARLHQAAGESAEAYNAALERINENLRRQSDLADARRQKQDLLNQAVERYGLTWEEAGRLFQRGTLADQAEQLIQDWKLLVESGADPSVIAQRMGASASAFVQQAVKSGTEIPDSMRPMLEEMESLGLLLDENGQSFRVEMLKFGAQLESMFERTLDRLNALIDELKAPPRPALARGSEPTVEDQLTGRSRPRRAHSGWFVGDMATDERAAVLQTNEMVLSRGLTRLLGGKSGFDELTAGRLPAAALANFELPDLHGYAAAALQDTWASPNLGDSNGAMAAFAGRQDGAGDIHVRVDQVIVKSDRPEQAAEAFLDALPMAVSRNRKGLRSKLRRQLGT